MNTDLLKLKKQFDILNKKVNGFIDKPYLIKNKDLTESISSAISPIFKEKEKIMLIRIMVGSMIINNFLLIVIIIKLIGVY